MKLRYIMRNGEKVLQFLHEHTEFYFDEMLQQMNGRPSFAWIDVHLVEGEIHEGTYLRPD